MAYSSNSTERSLAIMRVMIIYIILLFCSLVPIYYLLTIPDIAPLTVRNESKEKNLQEEQILEQYKALMGKLDVLYKGKQLNISAYRMGIDDLNRFAKDKVDSTKNLYWPLFLQIPDLYERIGLINEECTYKALYDQCSLDLKSKTDLLEKAEKELEKANSQSGSPGK
jgi:hypothetical protein